MDQGSIREPTEIIAVFGDLVMPGLDLVCIHWQDSSHGDPRWLRMEDLEDRPDMPLCVSVGFIVDEGMDYVTLAPTVGRVDEPDQTAYSGTHTIPKSAILRVLSARLYEKGSDDG